MSAVLVLASGEVFQGEGFGASGIRDGEVVFNTAMTGYQEILTDPSYAFQIVTFTYPHIGNVGFNPDDFESDKIHASGLVVRKYSKHYSNYRAKGSLESLLKEQDVVGLCGIDTRKLVLSIRDVGSEMAVLASGVDYDIEELKERAKSLAPMEGRNLAKLVSTKENYTWREGVWTLGQGGKQYSDGDLEGRKHVVVVDCGVKRNILRLLVEVGFKVTVVPLDTAVDDIKYLKPDALFISNGPGDPAPVEDGVRIVKSFIGKLPIFGICLGHQILGLALGAPTTKLKFGHHGANHPIRDTSGKVIISSQNHGFATDGDKTPESINVSHINLNDSTVAGFDLPDLKAFSVQYHPEAAPGPSDTKYLFEDFYNLVCREGR